LTAKKCLSSYLILRKFSAQFFVFVYSRKINMANIPGLQVAKAEYQPQRERGGKN